MERMVAKEEVTVSLLMILQLVMMLQKSNSDVFHSNMHGKKVNLLSNTESITHGCISVLIVTIG